MHYNRLRTTGALKTVIRPKGEGTITPTGYLRIGKNGADYADHRRIASNVLGKPLPRRAIVHHIDEDRLNNDPRNLVICSRSYHSLIHQRMNAVEACGRADWRKCQYCKQYDEPGNLLIQNTHAFHRTCANAYAREKYEESRSTLNRSRNGSAEHHARISAAMKDHYVKKRTHL